MARGTSKKDSAPVVLRAAHTPSGEGPAARYIERFADGADAENAGFSATCRNTSLADWVQLIQMGRRDAIIVIRTPDHGEGRLWCRAGDIIDARWGLLTGEEAVYRILSFDTGEVAVDFDAFERPRAIHTSTTGLLLQAAYLRDSVVLQPSVSPALPPRADSAAAGSSTAPHAHPTLPLPEGGRALNLRPLFWGGAMIAAFGIACWLSLRAGSGPSPTAQKGPSALVPAEEFLVHVEARPDQAEIRLDDKLVATRALTTRLPRDGRLHKVLVSAPGYVPELITFRDQATVEGITLERPAPIAAEAAGTHGEDTPSKARRGQVERRAPERAPEAAMRSATAALPPASETTPAPKPRIQIIDERQPWVQPIDDVQPRIKSIE